MTSSGVTSDAPALDAATRRPAVITMPRKVRLSPARMLRIAFLLVLAAYFGLPMLWMVLAPSKTASQLVARSPYAFGSFANYVRAWNHLLTFNDKEIYVWIINSIYYAGASTVLAVAVSVPAGYALASTAMRGRRVILLVTLVAMITPSSALVLPVFLELSQVHLTNTALAVILPHVFFPFGVYLAYIYFSTSLPPDLVEAARLDGASEIGAFVRVVLPIARPLFGLVAFFAFLGSWNDYFLPYVMLSSDRQYNLPVGLGALISGSPGVQPGQVASNLPIQQPEVALAGLIVVVPIAIVFLASQRLLVRGILAGAVKQ